MFIKIEVDQAGKATMLAVLDAALRLNGIKAADAVQLIINSITVNEPEKKQEKK